MSRQGIFRSVELQFIPFAVIPVGDAVVDHYLAAVAQLAADHIVGVPDYGRQVDGAGALLTVGIVPVLYGKDIAARAAGLAPVAAAPGILERIVGLCLDGSVFCGVRLAGSDFGSNRTAYDLQIAGSSLAAFIVVGFFQICRKHQEIDKPRPGYAQTSDSKRPFLPYRLRGEDAYLADGAFELEAQFLCQQGMAFMTGNGLRIVLVVAGEIDGLRLLAAHRKTEGHAVAQVETRKGKSFQLSLGGILVKPDSRTGGDHSLFIRDHIEIHIPCAERIHLDVHQEVLRRPRCRTCSIFESSVVGGIEMPRRLSVHEGIHAQGVDSRLGVGLSDGPGADAHLQQHVELLAEVRSGGLGAAGNGCGRQREQCYIFYAVESHGSD